MGEAESKTAVDPEEEILQALGGRLSEVAKMASRILQRAGAYSILHPACGPGGTSAYLARQGFSVTSYDVSQRVVEHAHSLAVQLGVRITCFADDILLPRRPLRRFDGLFAPNVLHQMLAAERRRLLRTFHRALRQGGVLVASVISIDDERYGYGREVEEDTFEFDPGEIVHFYGVPALHHEVSQFFEVADVDHIEETEEHLGSGKQTYRMLVVTAVKMDPDR